MKMSILITNCNKFKSVNKTVHSLDSCVYFKTIGIFHGGSLISRRESNRESLVVKSIPTELSGRLSDIS